MKTIEHKPIFPPPDAPGFPDWSWWKVSVPGPRVYSDKGDGSFSCREITIGYVRRRTPIAFKD